MCGAICTNLHQWRFGENCYFCSRGLNNLAYNEQFSKLLRIFAPLPDWFGRRTSRRAISFDPSENLENSKYKGEKSESCFSCSSIYTACSAMETARIYPCRCELIPLGEEQYICYCRRSSFQTSRPHTSNFPGSQTGQSLIALLDVASLSQLTGQR